MKAPLWSITKSTAEVVGKGEVYFYDRQQPVAKGEAGLHGVVRWRKIRLGQTSSFSWRQVRLWLFGKRVLKTLQPQKKKNAR